MGVDPHGAKVRPFDYNGKTASRVVVAQSGPGTTVLAAAQAGVSHKLIGGMLTMSADGTLKFSDDDGDLTGAMDIGQRGGFVVPHTDPQSPLIVTAVDSELKLVTTGGAAKGVLLYVTE